MKIKEIEFNMEKVNDTSSDDKDALKSKYLLYVKGLILMNALHKDVFGKDKNIKIPSLLSEGIVRLLYDLEPYTGKDKKYDAEKKVDDKNNEYYEIKGTSSKKGTTTINLKEKADQLIWVYFNFSENQIEIKSFEKFNDKGKTKLVDFIKSKKIRRIKRKPNGEKQYSGGESFNEVFSDGKSGRTTINLDYLLWNKTKYFDMNTLEEIKNDEKISASNVL